MVPNLSDHPSYKPEYIIFGCPCRQLALIVAAGSIFINVIGVLSGEGETESHLSEFVIGEYLSIIASICIFVANKIEKPVLYWPFLISAGYDVFCLGLTVLVLLLVTMFPSLKDDKILNNFIDDADSITSNGFAYTIICGIWIAYAVICSKIILLAKKYMEKEVVPGRNY